MAGFRDRLRKLSQERIDELQTKLTELIVHCPDLTDSIEGMVFGYRFAKACQMYAFKLLAEEKVDQDVYDIFEAAVGHKASGSPYMLGDLEDSWTNVASPLLKQMMARELESDHSLEAEVEAAARACRDMPPVEVKTEQFTAKVARGRTLLVSSDVVRRVNETIKNVVTGSPPGTVFLSPYAHQSKIAPGLLTVAYKDWRDIAGSRKKIKSFLLECVARLDCQLALVVVGCGVTLANIPGESVIGREDTAAIRESIRLLSKPIADVNASAIVGAFPVNDTQPDTFKQRLRMEVGTSTDIYEV